MVSTMVTEKENHFLCLYKWDFQHLMQETDKPASPAHWGVPCPIDVDAFQDIWARAQKRLIISNRDLEQQQQQKKKKKDEFRIWISFVVSNRHLRIKISYYLLYILCSRPITFISNDNIFNLGHIGITSMNLTLLL